MSLTIPMLPKSVGSGATLTLTIKGAGTAKITATRSTDSNTAKEFTASFTLIVEKGDQPAFNFSDSDKKINLTFSPGLKIDNIAPPTGGIATGEISYSIDNTNVATISINTGVLTITGAGVAIITATKEGNANYNEVSTTYLLTVAKAEQDALTFTESSITVNYVPNQMKDNEASGGSGSGKISYTIDPTTGVATINSTNGKLIIQGVGTATITVTKAGDANYKPVSSTYRLVVKEVKEFYIF